MKAFYHILFFFLAANNLLNANSLPAPTSPCATVTLNAGSLILLETAEKIWSDQVTVGKVFHFRVTTNVMAEGKVAIATGAVAVGRVKAIQSNTFNNPEEIRIEMLYVQAVDGQMVPLYGNEQSFQGQYPNQATAIEFASFMTAQVTNNIDIKVN